MTRNALGLGSEGYSQSFWRIPIYCWSSSRHSESDSCTVRDLILGVASCMFRAIMNATTTILVALPERSPELMGTGTRDIFELDSRRLYCRTHEIRAEKWFKLQHQKSELQPARQPESELNRPEKEPEWGLGASTENPPLKPSWIQLRYFHLSSMLETSFYWRLLCWVHCLENFRISCQFSRHSLEKPQEIHYNSHKTAETPELWWILWGFSNSLYNAPGKKVSNSTRLSTPHPKKMSANTSENTSEPRRNHIEVVQIVMHFCGFFLRNIYTSSEKMPENTSENTSEPRRSHTEDPSHVRAASAYHLFFKGIFRAPFKITLESKNDLRV